MTTTSATSATSAAAPIALTFSFNDPLVLQAMEGLTQEELWRRLTPSTNPMLWVAGHIVQTRAMVLQMLGQPADTGWGGLFDRGAKIGDPKDYPAGSEIVRVMNEIGPRLHAAISGLQEEQLNRPASLPIPGIHTLTDELAFFSLHESYHVGQLAFLRKGLGYPGMTD
jgi:hypothetical protein